jgi:hypothetical protein
MVIFLGIATLLGHTKVIKRLSNLQYYSSKYTKVRHNLRDQK